MNWNLLDEQWRQRHDEAQFAQMENALDKALYNTVGNAEYALLWRWARMSHFRAMQAEEEGKTAEAAARHYSAAAEEAATASELQPNRVEGHYWHGVCLIEAARRNGWLAVVRALPLAAGHIERAREIDGGYHSAGPLRVQGDLLRLQPRLLNGRAREALAWYQRALEVAPGNSSNLLRYAGALVAARKREEARQVLTGLIEAPEDTDWLWEQGRDRREAAVKLRELA